MPEPGPRPSTGITRLLRYHEPLRLPQRPKAGHFRPPGWWTRPHHRHGSRTLPQRPCAHADPTTPAGEDELSGRLLPRPPTAFPFWQEGRLQRETIEACSGFNFLSACALAPWLHQGLPRRLQWTISRLNCSSGYRANRQFPGRDLHPLAFETQEVSPLTDISSHQSSLRAALPAGSAGGPFSRRRPFRLAPGASIVKEQGCDEPSPAWRSPSRAATPGLNLDPARASLRRRRSSSARTVASSRAPPQACLASSQARRSRAEAGTGRPKLAALRPTLKPDVAGLERGASRLRRPVPGLDAPVRVCAGPSQAWRRRRKRAASRLKLVRGCGRGESS
jgi:hypothetical protein